MMRASVSDGLTPPRGREAQLPQEMVKRAVVIDDEGSSRTSSHRRLQPHTSTLPPTLGAFWGEWPGGPPESLLD